MKVSRWPVDVVVAVEAVVVEAGVLAVAEPVLVEVGLVRLRGRWAEVTMLHELRMAAVTAVVVEITIRTLAMVEVAEVTEVVGRIEADVGVAGVDTDAETTSATTGVMAVTVADTPIPVVDTDIPVRLPAVTTRIRLRSATAVMHAVNLV